MKKCLVTGGKGFIGSHFVNFLKDKGHYVINADISRMSYLPTRENRFYNVDLRKLGAALTVSSDVDWIFNFAANMGGIGYITELNAPIMRDNATINLNMLEASRKLGNVERIYYPSSACVYPRFLQDIPDAPPLKESDVVPAHPDSAYGWEKLFSEFVYKSYKKDYGLDVRITRFQNIFGSHCSFNNGKEKFPAALCRKVSQAEDGGSIIIWGDGKQKRSYIWVDDVVEVVYLLMQSDYSDPLNIGSDIFISVNDLTRMVMDIAGKKLRIINDLSKPQGVRGRRADLTLLKKVLNWEAKTSLRKGMKTLYYWVNSQMKMRI